MKVHYDEGIGIGLLKARSTDTRLDFVDQSNCTARPLLSSCLVHINHALVYEWSLYKIDHSRAIQ